MDIISYVFAGLSCVGMIVSIILSIIKSKKAGSSNITSTLLQQLPNLITEAEQMFGSGKGIYKLQWVLTQLEILALKNNTILNRETWTNYINSYVETTNNVNVNKEVANGTGTNS